MGQYTSRILDYSSPDSNQSQQHDPSRNLESIPAASASVSDNSRNLLRIRRRRSSLNTSTLPPSRRRRVLGLWGSRAATNELQEALNEDSPLDNNNDNNVIETNNVEGTSGSGNITRNPTNTEIPSSSNFMDELDNIASDLFNSVSRERRPRVRQYTSWSSLRSESSSSNYIQNHNNSHNNNHNHNHNWFGNNSIQDNDISTADDFATSVNHNTVSFASQVEMLSRLLEVAATSTIYTLLGSSSTNGRRFDNSSSRTTGNSESTNRIDSTFQEFLDSLRHGLLNNELSDNNENDGSSEDRTFFRAFRFDSEDEELSDANNSTVPVMIVGVRSVNQGNDNRDSSFSHNRENEVNMNDNFSNNPSFSPSRGHRRARSDLSFTSSTDESIDLNNDHSSRSHVTNQRSWIIFVMGNTFTWNHPLLSAPSLMSENPTYEDLMNLQELIGQVKPQVVSTEELQKHDDQLFELRITSDSSFIKSSEYEVYPLPAELERCHICLTDYDNHEIIRKLSTCNHFYHKECVDTWLLKGKNNCPLCRSKVINEENTV